MITTRYDEPRDGELQAIVVELRDGDGPVKKSLRVSESDSDYVLRFELTAGVDE